MAAIKLSLLLIVATIGLVLSTVFTFNWAAEVDAPASDSTQTDATRAKIEEMWRSIQNEYYVPQEVLGKLNELKKILEASALTDGMDDIKNQVNALIKMAEFDKDQCTDIEIYELVADINAIQSSSKPLQIYQRHYKHEFINRCIVYMANEVRLAFFGDNGRKDTGEVLKHSPKLFEVVLMSGLDSMVSKQRDLGEGNDHLRRLRDALNKDWLEGWKKLVEVRPSQKLSLEDYFQKSVIRPCKGLLEASLKLRETYKYLLKHIGLLDTYENSDTIFQAFYCEYLDLNYDKVYRDLLDWKEKQEMSV